MQFFVGLFVSFYNAICVILHCYMRHFASSLVSFLNQKSPASKLNLKWYGKRNANLNEIGILLFVWNKCFVI